MNSKNKDYIVLILWIVSLLCIGSVIGSLTKSQINTWYLILNRSPLTPPNYVFPIAWTLLYIMIAICGWMIWRTQPFPKLNFIKNLYGVQLILNWLWSPLFFNFHLTGMSLICILVMDILVFMIIWLTYVYRIRSVSLSMIPYLMWISFATHLNFYIWLYN